MQKYTRKAQVATPDPDSPEGLEIGLAEPPLPGGQPHVPIAPSAPDKMYDKPAPNAFTGMMAHGVYAPYVEPAKPNPDVEHEHRATEVPAPEPKKLNEPKPVPVYIVEKAGGAKPLNTYAVMTVQVPATAPVPLAGKDNHRTRVRLLNEDATNNARFSSRQSDLTSGNGALLKAGATSYLTLDTQAPVYAMATTATVSVSVIFEFEVPGAD